MSNLRAGAIAIVLIVVATYFGFTKSNPFADPFVLRAAFKDAGSLNKNARVRVAGVEIGVVESVKPLGDGGPGALVTMRIKEHGLPIREDATVKVRPRIFLEGNYFVDIEPGSPSAPAVKDGATIPVSQTAAPVALGQVLATLQDDTRQSLREVFDELGRAFEGGGAEGLNGAIKHWAPAFRDSSVVNEATLGTMQNDLSGYIASAGAVSAALDRDPEALKGLITDFATTADALADQEQRLGQGIGLLDDTLVVARGALAQVDVALPSLRRLVGALRPAARAARPALDAALPLVRQLRSLVSDAELRGLVRDLRPTVPSLVRLAEGGVPLQEQARLLASCQVNVVLPTTNAKIVDEAIPTKGKVYEEAPKGLPGLAGESRSFDAHGQYTKTLAQTANFAYLLPGGRFFATTKPLQGVNPPKPAKVPPFRNDVPCETQEPPDLRSRPAAPPAAIRIDHFAPAAVERRIASTKRAVTALRGILKATGMDDEFRVADTPLTPAQLKQLPRAKDSR
jgi:phospholipid/cholesterol/gamma-HCH transport system substrate-binding protein